MESVRYPDELVMAEGYPAAKELPGRPPLALANRLAEARRGAPLTAEEVARRQTYRRNRPAILTHLELAKRVGVPMEYIGDYERGNRRPSLQILQRLAAALDLPLPELVVLGQYLPEILGMRYILVPAGKAEVLGRLAAYDEAALLQLVDAADQGRGGALNK